MFKILCPTDFSPNSEFAIEYAVNLANDLQAKLYFITSYKVPHVAGSMRSLGDKIDDALKEDLIYFVDKFKPLIKTGLEPELITVEGNTTVSILHYAKQQQIDMIVMGTKGSTGLSNLLVGSITRKFFDSSPIPVLAIPSSLRYQVTRNTILLSLDSRGIGNENAIALLKVLKEVPDAKIDVFHVTLPNEKVTLNENTKLLSGLINNIIDVEGIDPVVEIKRYVDENEIGILAMVGRKHTFWERLFLESNTSAELFATNVPILYLPE
jgi:nucleotide-binding universal stress UspA family protein